MKYQLILALVAAFGFASWPLAIAEFVKPHISSDQVENSVGLFLSKTSVTKDSNLRSQTYEDNMKPSLAYALETTSTVLTINGVDVNTAVASIEGVEVTNTVSSVDGLPVSTTVVSVDGIPVSTTLISVSDEPIIPRATAKDFSRVGTNIAKSSKLKKNPVHSPSSSGRGRKNKKNKESKKFPVPVAAVPIRPPAIVGPPQVQPSGSQKPSQKPGKLPTKTPSKKPSQVPSTIPSNKPSQNSKLPTKTPSKKPSQVPSTIPSNKPSQKPSRKPIQAPSTSDPLDTFSLIISSDPQYPWYTKNGKYPQNLPDINECNIYSNDTCRGDGNTCLDRRPKFGPNCATNDEPDNNAMKRNSARMISQQYQSMTTLQGDPLQGKRNIQGVFINGDLTNLAKDWHWEKAEELIKILSNASLRVFPSLGNHDYDVNVNLNFAEGKSDASRMVKVMTDWLSNQWHSNPTVELSKAPMCDDTTKFIGSLAYSFNIGKIHILQLQFYPSFAASWTDNSKTYDIIASWDFMANDLGKARNRGDIIIVFLHSYESSPSMKPADKIQFDELMTKFGVSAIFAGHVHESYGKINSDGAVPFFRSGSADFQVYLVADIDVNKKKMKVWLSEDTTSLNVKITNETVGLIDENAAEFPSGQYNSNPQEGEANKVWEVVLNNAIPTIPEIVPDVTQLTC